MKSIKSDQVLGVKSEQILEGKLCKIETDKEISILEYARLMFIFVFQTVRLIHTSCTIICRTGAITNK